MKTLLISLTAALLAVAGSVHAGAAPAASAPMAQGKTGDGHAHEHGGANAVGVPGVASKVSRTINVDMSDAMRFTPASISARQGQTIRFKIRNSGQLKHEFVLNTDKELKEHYELMMKFPEMEHAEPNMVTLAPGQTGEVIWQFTKAGKIDFACLQPGHYDAGMKGAVNVAAVKGMSTQADSHGTHQH